MLQVLTKINIMSVEIVETAWFDILGDLSGAYGAHSHWAASAEPLARTTFLGQRMVSEHM